MLEAPSKYCYNSLSIMNSNITYNGLMTLDTDSKCKGRSRMLEMCLFLLLFFFLELVFFHCVLLPKGYQCVVQLTEWTY